MWDLLDAMTSLRKTIEDQKVYVLHNKKYISELVTGDKGEMMANITLAYRHLEDAKMRVGKVIQAYEGKSCYDK